MAIKSSVDVLYAKQTELELHELMEETPVISEELANSATEFGVYNFNNTIVWEADKDLPAKDKDSAYTGEVVPVITELESEPRFTDSMLFHELLPQIPAKSVYIPLASDLKGYYFDNTAYATDIVGNLAANGTDCSASTNQGVFSFDPSGYNTTYTRNYYKTLHAIGSSEGTGIADVESIGTGPLGKDSYTYKKLSNVKRFVRKVSNIKIFKDPLFEGQLSPQCYQLSFYARADKNCSFSLALTENLSLLPFDYSLGILKNADHTGKGSDVNGILRYQNTSADHIDIVKNNWNFYWVNFTLPTQDKSLESKYDQLYIQMYFTDSNNPDNYVSAEVSNIQLIQTQELGGFKPSVAYESVYPEKDQTLWLNPTNALPEDMQGLQPAYVTFCIDRYSSTNDISLLIRSTLLEEDIPAELPSQAFQYSNSESAGTVDNYSTKCLILLSRIAENSNEYSVYSVTNLATKYIKLGSVQIPDSRISISALNDIHCFTGIGVSDFIACYDNNALGNLEEQQNMSYLFLQQGKVKIPTEINKWGDILNTQDTEDYTILNHANIREKDIDHAED